MEDFIKLFLQPLGVCFNILAMIVLSHPKLRTKTFNQLLLVLAFFGTLNLISLFVRYLTFFDVPGSYYIIILNPHFWSPMATFGAFGATFTTTAITLERYLAVCQPHLHGATKSKIKQLMIYLGPVLLLTLAFTVISNFELTLNWKDEERPFVVPQTDMLKDPRYLIPYAIIYHAIPILIVAVLLVPIIWTADTRRRKLLASGLDGKLDPQLQNESQDCTRDEDKLAKVWVMFAIIFLLSHVLLFVTFIMHVITSVSTTGPLWTILWNWVYLTKIVYHGSTFVLSMATNKKFRRVFLDTFCCCWLSSDNQIDIQEM